MPFTFERLSDPGYFRENRLDAHSDHVALDAEGNSLRMSLNGAWYFFHARNESQVIPGFEAADFDCRGWETIPVPAHIQMEGYGHLPSVGLFDPAANLQFVVVVIRLCDVA